jgi:uncharacterized coiled-coil protein SlyX/uncharacterized small protein (DUF1192 family)
MATSKQTDDLKEQKKLIEEIKNLYQQVYGESIPIEKLEFLKKAPKEAVREFKLLQKEVENLNTNFGSIFKSLSGIVSEISKSSIEVRETNKGFNNLYSISSKIFNLDVTSGEVKKKTFANLKQSITAEQNRLSIIKSSIAADQTRLAASEKSNEAEIERLKAEIDSKKFSAKIVRENKEEIKKLIAANTKNGKIFENNKLTLENITKSLDENEGIIVQIQKVLKETENRFDGINKKVGVFGATVEGIGKGLTKAGFGRLADALGIDDAITKTKKFVDESKGAASGFSVAGKLLKELGSNLVKSLTLTDLIVGGLTAVVIGLINRFKELDKDASEFARALGTSRDNAFDLRQQLNSVGNISGELFLTGGKIAKVFGDIASSVSLGIAPNTKIGDTLAVNLAYMTKMVEQGKFSKEAAEALFRISSSTGKPVGKISQEAAITNVKLNLQNKSSISLRSVMEAIGKSTAATRLTLAKFPDGIAGAITKAKSLGFELDDLNKIADSLLNFEESISSEFEAELLTNKDLNLERARAFALQGNSVELAKELSRQLGTSADFQNMNVIQQNSLAKAFGLSRDELAKTLETQDALKALGESSVEDAQKRFKTLEKEVGTQEALQILGNNSLTQQFATASRQEKINALTDKFLALAEKLLIPLSKAADFVLGIADGMSNIIGFFSRGTKEADAMGQKLDDVNNKAKNLKSGLGLSEDMKSAIGKIASIGAIIVGLKGLSSLFKFFTRGASPLNPIYATIVGGLKSLGSSLGLTSKTAATTAAGTTTAAGAAAAAAPGAVASKTSPTGYRIPKGQPGAGRFAAAPAAAAAPEVAAGAGGGFFSKISGAFKTGINALKPSNILKTLTNSVRASGGIKGVLGKALKGSALNTILSTVFAISDIRDLLKNPVDENGNQLSKADLAQRVGKVALGSVGSTLGGIIGTALGGPVGTFVGSFGGDWLSKKLADAFPSFTQGVGELIVPKSVSETLPGYAEGGLFPATPGGRAIRVAEGGKAEIVSPVEKLIDPLAAAIAALSTKLDEVVNATKASGQMVAMAVQDNSGMTLDGDVITRKVMSRMNTQYSGIK